VTPAGCSRISRRRCRIITLSGSMPTVSRANALGPGADARAALDNMSNRKTEAIRNWFAKKPRRHVHCIPASASWINQVKYFFTTNPTSKYVAQQPGTLQGNCEIGRKRYYVFAGLVSNFIEKQIRRGIHCSTAKLETAVTSYIETVNTNPKPFAWTESADDILATIKRFCLRTMKSAEIRTEIGKTSQSGH
jgi:hypothetical protein